jgi:hypothetical protein
MCALIKRVIISILVWEQKIVNFHSERNVALVEYLYVHHIHLIPKSKYNVQSLLHDNQFDACNESNLPAVFVYCIFSEAGKI